MKTWIFLATACFFVISYLSACSPKYGCPANGKSVGAERVLSGEKTPKAKSFNH